MKDSVFSMFGGGAKKEKATEEEGEPDRSGSSKAKKDAEAAEKEDAGEERVGCHHFCHFSHTTHEDLENLNSVLAC